MSPRFVEIGRDVHVLRYPVLDVNVTLILGETAALIVDTLSTDAQAVELREAARRLTGAPLRLVNTHHHFDHWFGNGVLADDQTPIWAHEEAEAVLRRRAEALRTEWVAEWAPSHPDLAAGMATATLRLPNRTFHSEATLDIGGREVVLRHLGRGHTDGDLVVSVPDADILLAGDLVEEGGPPMFGDAYPIEWPETLAALLRLTSPTTAVVPGHGAVVDPAFVHGQHDALTALAWLIRDGHADGASVEAVAAKAPIDQEAALIAVARGYAELSGRA
jgi:glyoxylase-like metal-dependent hydrolase (beta-lactamase superfamily II)